MTVYHLTTQYPPHSLGGLGTHVYHLGGALAHHCGIRIVAPERLGMMPDRGVRVLPVPGGPLDAGSAAAWSTALAGEIRRAGGPAVIHAHNYETALPALAARRLTGVPLVATIHLPAPPSRRALEERLLRNADAVIAVSHSLAGELSRRGFRAETIHNGATAPIPEVRLRRRRCSLLMAGRLCPQKGVDTAIHAVSDLCRRFPNLSLRIAGAGAWKQAYVNLARDLGCPDRVRWLGWLGPEALQHEYRQCTLFLMPSRYEPFGLSALEAMARGAPVVAANVGGLPEFVRDPETGLLVSPDDPVALAEAAARLLTQPEERRRMSASAKAASRSFSWTAAAKATAAVYARLGTCRPECRYMGGEARTDARTVITKLLQEGSRDGDGG